MNIVATGYLAVVLVTYGPTHYTLNSFLEYMDDIAFQGTR